MNQLDNIMMPCSNDAESALLGAVLLDNDLIITLIEKLQPNDFYIAKHRIIFEGMISLYNQKSRIDYITLEAELLKKHKPDEYGETEYLSELIERIPLIPNFEHYIKILQDCSVRRAIISMTLNLNKEAYNPDIEISELKKQFSLNASMIEKANNEMNDTCDSIEAITACDLKLEQIQNDKSLGIKTGIAKVDEMTAGFQPGNLIILAGWSSRGKSTLAMNIYRHMTVELKQPALYFSIESNRAAFMVRMLCAECQINSNRFRNQRLDSSDAAVLRKAKNKFKQSPMYINDNKRLRIENIVSHVRQAISKYNIQVVFIDYLQLIRVDKTRNENREESISNLSREFQYLSSEFNIPFVVICQLNFPSSWDKMTENNKLKEQPNAQTQLQYCKKIWHDADVVMTINNGLINIEKNREGPTGSILVEHEPKYFLIEDIDKSANNKKPELFYESDDDCFNPNNI